MYLSLYKKGGSAGLLYRLSNPAPSWEEFWEEIFVLNLNNINDFVVIGGEKGSLEAVMDTRNAAQLRAFSAENGEEMTPDALWEFLGVKKLLAPASIPSPQPSTPLYVEGQETGLSWEH